jgi:hypothetical protein
LGSALRLHQYVGHLAVAQARGLGSFVAMSLEKALA